MEKKSTLTIRVLLICLSVITGMFAHAQTVADYTFSSFAGTYTPIAGGQVLGNTTSDDQRYVDPALPLGGTGTTGVGLPIGFNFVYAGNTFDRIAINTNGWISFGNSALTPSVNNASGSSYTAISATSTATPTYLRSRIAGLARDLQCQGGSEIRYETIGTTPNQQLVVQYTNMRKFGSGNTLDTLNFQIILNETSNVIQIVYGKMINNATTGTAQVGLGGSVNTEFNNRSVTADWTNSVAGAVNTATCTISNLITLPSGYTYQWTPPVLCAGVPTAGATVSTANPTCPNVNFTLSMPNAPTGQTGLSYQWLSSSDGINYTDIAGATSATRTDTTTSVRYYRAIITCANSGLSDTSIALMVTLLPPLQCYCASTYTNGCSSFNDNIANVTLNTLNNSSTCTPAPFYTFYNNVTIPDVPQTGTNNLFVTFGSDGTQYGAVWVDYNQDGDFDDADEFVDFSTVNAGASGTTLLEIIPPLTSLLGQTRMRIRGGNDGQLTNTPCGASSSGFGETEDYLINITVAPPCVSPSGVSISGVTDSTATVTWTSYGINSSIEVGTLGFTLGTGTLITGLTSPYTVTGLNPQTSYSVYLTDSCSGGTFSTATGPTSFTTLCSPYPYPGDNAASAITVGSYPFVDTINTATDPCFTDNSPLRTGTDIYYRFTTDPCATSVTVALCGSSFDTYLYIRDALDTITIAENDDACALQSQYTISGTELVPGATYLAVIEPFSSGGTGEIVVNITQTLGITTPGLSSTSSNAACPNSSDGSAQVLVTSGNATPVSYMWSLGQTTDTVSGLAPGNYWVTVTNGCGGSDSTIVSVYSDFSVFGDVTNVSCNSGNNGAIDLILDGETAPVFAWGGGETTEDISVLTAGVYPVTVTDGACIFADSFEVFEPAAITLSVDTVINVGCNGGNDGGIQVTAVGGSQFNYNQSVTASGGGLGATTTLTLTGTPVASTTGTVTFSAIGDIDGDALSANLEAWTFYDESNNQLAVVGGSGDFNDQCTVAPLSVTVNLSPAQIAAWTANGSITFTAIATANVNLTLCGNDYISAAVQYVSGFNYLWSNAATTQDISGLAANNYTLTITDANSCQFTSSAIAVTEPTALVAVVDSSTNVLCYGGSTGSAYITVTGGTAPYDYTWTGGSTDEDPAGLIAGSYTAAVSDNNGCVATTSSVTITEPVSAVSAVVDSVTNVACSNSFDGAIYITISGGTAPYGNVWSNGILAEDLIGVYPGDYTSSVTDANGCAFALGPVTISSPTDVVVTLDSSTNVACNGASTGSIYTSLSGGTSPYIIVWNTNDSTLSILNLPAGSYTPTITDSNACVYTGTPIDITEPTALLPSVDSIVNVKCNGGSDGGIYISVTGGATPYSFAWSNGTSNEDLVNVPAGTYTGVLTDGNGCVSSSPPIPITQPTVLAINVDSVTNVSCNGGNNGAIYVTVSGGTSPYSSSWVGGATSEDLTGIEDGAYIQTITDNNGCVLVGAPVSVTEPNVLLLGVDSITNVACNGGSTGCVSITVSGGTAPYIVLWNTGSTTEDLCNLASGPYTPTITDAKGCVLAGQPNVVTQPTNALAASTIATDQIQGGALGAINLSPSGGTAPYDFDWNNAATTEDLSGLAAGVYTCTITDANGCTEVVSDTINLIIGIENVTAANFSVSIYPNPAQNHAFVEIALNTVGEVSAEIYNVNGQLVDGYYSAHTQNVKFDMSFEKEAAGVYYVKIKSGDSVVTKRIVVTR